MNAWIIAIGSELLTPFRIDTNSLVITERLNAIGCRVDRKVIVGDDLDRLTRMLRDATAAADVVVCTGGLGPTDDDVTREAVARAFDLPLDVDHEVERAIEDRLARRGLTMTEINRRQAQVPRGAVVLPNANGTAPGLWLERDRSVLILLPGPRREMLPMLEQVIAARLAERSAGARLHRRVVKTAGRPESEIESKVQHLYGVWRSRTPSVDATVLASPGQVELHVSAVSSDEAEGLRALTIAVEDIVAVLGHDVVSTDGGTIEAVVGDLLKNAGMTIALAESCTGGLLASRLTDVPGSSAYVERGAVCYSNSAKIEWLGVPDALIAAYGAVSEPVAVAMADGIRQAASTSLGVGITGIAGPSGGSAEKPVGTVVIALAAAEGSRVRTFRFLGSREHVKEQASTTALNMIRLWLLHEPTIW